MRLYDTTLSILALLLAGVAIAGCGGGHANAVPAGADGATQAAVRLTLPRPPASSRGLRFVSPSVRSAVLQVNGGTGQVLPLVAGAPGCSPVSSGLTCTFTISVVPGNDTFAVALYDGTNGNGSLLGSGSATATVAPNALTPVGITVGGTVATVALALAPVTPVSGTASTIAVSVTAADADGNVIIADPYATPILLADSDTSGTTQLSTTTVASPAQAVSLSFNGTWLPNATISATIGSAATTAATAVLTPKTASTADWATFGYDAQRTGNNPNETLCCRSAPSVMWSYAMPNLDKYVTAQPVFANNIFTSLVGGGAYVDLLYVADNHGMLVALNAATGAVVWQTTLGHQVSSCADLPDHAFGITGTPYFDRTGDRLYVVDGTGILWALDPATGKVASRWPTNGISVINNSASDHVYGAVSLDTVRGILAIPTASYCDLTPWNGSLRFVSAAAASVVDDFVFGAASASTGGGMWGMGGVSLDPATGDFIGASGNLEPNQVEPYSNSVIRWATGTWSVLASFESNNGVDDDDFGAIPSLFPASDGTPCGAASNKGAILYVFNRNAIGNGPTSNPQLGTASSDDYNSYTPAYSPVTGKIYIPVGLGSTNFPPGIYAFTVQAGCTINVTPDWGKQLRTAMGILSPVTVANGVTFIGNGADSSHGVPTQVTAFDASTGALLWHTGNELSGATNIFAGITVVNGMMFVAGWDGTIRAYAAPGLQGSAKARRTVR